MRPGAQLERHGVGHGGSHKTNHIIDQNLWFPRGDGLLQATSATDADRRVFLNLPFQQ